MKWEEVIRKLESRRRELQLEEPKKIKPLSERLLERAVKLKEVSEEYRKCYRKNKKVSISFSHRIDAYNILDEEQLQEVTFSTWEKYEIEKKRKTSKIDRKFIREELRRVKGEGYNSQRFEILLKNFDKNDFIECLEAREIFKKLIEVEVKLDGFILSLEYFKEYLNLLIYRINVEESRIMLA